MKNFILSFGLVLFFSSVAVYAGGYETAMKKNLDKLNAAETIESMQEAVNGIERIAQKETDKWVPKYWMTYAYTIMSFMEKDAAKKDLYLDKAQGYLDEAMKISENNSELTVLQSMVYSGRLQVDPASRGMEYGPKASIELGKAKGQDANNPRIYYMEGQSLMYTPEQYGGGMEKACEAMNKSKELYASFELKDELHPHWGEERLDQLMQGCKN